MGKWDVDTSEYDETKDGSGYDGDEPKKGIYDGKLVSFKEHTSANGNEGLEWIFEITEEPFAGWRGWVYSNDNSTMWRTQQCANAIQGGKKGKVALKPSEEDEDGTKSANVKKAKPVRLAIKRETYEGEPKARIRSVLVAEGKSKRDESDEDPFGDD